MVICRSQAKAKRDRLFTAKDQLKTFTVVQINDTGIIFKTS